MTMISRDRITPQSVWIGALFVGLFGLSSAALAQSGAVNIGDELTPAQREQLHQQLLSQATEFQRLHSLFKTVTRLVSASVVHIDATTTNRSRNQTVEEAGSGVIVEHNGGFYVVTNRHVVKSAKLANITIRFHSGEEVQPLRMIADEQTDLAVLVLPGVNYTAARIGRSGDLEIGDSVVAVGSPFGLAHSVTCGIVSAKGRRDLQLGEGGAKVDYQDFIQTDAAINPGNSGGPLFNIKAEVVGINTAIASNSGGSEGIGFAIPIDMAISVVRQLIERNKVVRGKLGVSLDPKYTYEVARNAGLPRLVGARVTNALAGSVAEKSGIKSGDIILRFGGVTIDNDTHLVSVIGVSPVDTDIPVDVVRDRQVTRITVRLAAP